MPESTGAQGRLAQMIATRGGLAPPEEPFVIEHREALFYMLCEASELEHGIMCQYLYAAFSLKQSADEGLTAAEAEAVQRWRKHIFHIGAQEMLHLALVQNLLTATGAAPHLSRPNFPQPASHYPAGVHLALVPFGEEALRHFMFLERPEGMDLEDAAGMAAFANAAPLAVPRVQVGEIVPRGQDFATVGHLYRSIEAGIAHLAEKLGEEVLFIGPSRAQATQQYFGWPELIAVTDVASAQRAIDEILEQGEGPRGNWRDAHFGQFVAILEEYLQLREANPAFDPVRPVDHGQRQAVRARHQHPAGHRPDRPPGHGPVQRQLRDPAADAAALLRAHRGDRSPAQGAGRRDRQPDVRRHRADRRPGHDAPGRPEYPGRTAGPSFELFYESDYVLPHREAAWVLLVERLRQAADFCEPGAPCDPQVTEGLRQVRTNLTGIADALTVHLPARYAPQAPAGDPGPLLARASDYYRTGQAFAPGDDPALSGVAALLASACQAALASDPRTLARLVDSVLRPLAETLPAPALPSTTPAPPPPTPQESHPSLWDLAVTATTLRARLADSAPPGLLEASAALQDLAVNQAPAGERPQRIAELGQLQRELPPAIMTAKNGPYLVTNVTVLRTPLGGEVPVPPQLALCRCGASATKPFCDGSHTTSGFTDGKDPNRVPDQRDTYLGQQVTIFDNRGICQHSGLCSDRAPTAFRTRAEPFVAPSGARLDELVRAVRDCPSGALSLGFDGPDDKHEARDLADWHGTRERAIEVTQDGPYRVTGAIPLTDTAGGDVPRAAGSSREHFALCRCGQSQNKPFCSGMHWYVDFRDPARPADPTLFEWAGGLPALTRMTRLLYEKHVPADDLLAPLFASMAPDRPQREAAVIAAAFGGPAAPQAPVRPDMSEEQRARWVALAVQAAGEAGLPADPPFRSALVSYLEWSSRATDAPAPAWDWGPAGPPGPVQPSTEEEAPVTLPGPDETVSFAAHVKPLFREHDRKSMTFAFDLWSQADVQAHAAGILDRLVNGTMPCDGAWPQDKIDVFRRWTESGYQP